MNKKAQAGTTITWVFAFVIIFFILFVFAVSSVLFAVHTEISSEISTLMSGSKSYFISAVASEPKGFDPGDLAAQRELSAFLNSENELNGANISMRDLISSFDGSVYTQRLNYDEIKKNEKYNLFYQSGTSFFDKIYDECYILCLEFKRGEEPATTNSLVGMKCPQGSTGEDIYLRPLYFDCSVSSSSVPSGVFSYASFELPSVGASKEISARIKLLKGGVSQ